MITQKYLKECLSYDPETGEFFWIVRPRSHFKTDRACSIWNSRFPDSEAGTMVNGYRSIAINSKIFKAHRLAFVFMGKGMPSDGVDHINGISSDNRWSNLREASQLTNTKNQKNRSSNKSGFPGVFWKRDLGKWQSQITVNYKTKYLGVFSSLDDAVAARKSAEAEHGFHSNHGRSS